MEWPARCKRPAMRLPMAPRPMKPRFAMTPPDALVCNRRANGWLEADPLAQHAWRGASAVWPFDSGVVEPSRIDQGTTPALDGCFFSIHAARLCSNLSFHTGFRGWPDS